MIVPANREAAIAEARKVQASLEQLRVDAKVRGLQEAAIAYGRSAIRIGAEIIVQRCRALRGL